MEIKVGIPPYKIIFSGVGKIDEEIRQALELDILMINVESGAELNRVEESLYACASIQSWQPLS